MGTSKINSYALIQRLQTLFLALAAIINFGVYFSPIYSHAVNDPSVWIGNGFAIVLAIAMIAAATSIFLYKNRLNQLKWVKFGTYFQIAALAFSVGVLFSLGGIGTFLWQETLSVGFLVLSLGCFWQAGRLIKKDEDLVRSMDRIR